MKPLIKICGVADGDNLIKLINIEKINFLGFIFYKQSARQQKSSKNSQNTKI